MKDRTQLGREFDSKPLIEKYVTKDRQHLKFMNYAISYSGDGQYCGAIMASIWLDKDKRLSTICILSNACCNSAEDAFSFCKSGEKLVLNKIIKDEENNNLLYKNNINNLAFDLRSYCIFKKRNKKDV